jgi:hypothetical protein
MTFAELTEVWNPLSALIAAISGVLFGFAFGWLATSPTHSRSDLGTPRRIALWAGLFAASAGLVFYAGQTLGSFLSADPHWSRVMSRYGEWLVFSGAIAATAWALIRHDRWMRRLRARNRAISEMRHD